MDIREIIRMARSITDGDTPGLVVPRAQVIASYGGQVDAKAEECVSSLSAKFPQGLQIVQVTPPLLTLASAKSGMPIKIRRVDTEEDNPLYGFVEPDKNGAIVRYRADLNICWRRFTVAKELFHLYADIADDPRSRRSDAITQAAMDARTVVPSDGKQLDDEVVAFYLALEYLIPWRLRRQFLTLRDCAATTYQIAKVFMVPLPFIEHMCDGGYAELSHRINNNI